MLYLVGHYKVSFAVFSGVERKCMHKTEAYVARCIIITVVKCESVDRRLGYNTVTGC